MIYFAKRFIAFVVISLSLNFALLAQDIAVTKIQLSAQEEVDLNQGKVILKGEQGDYWGQVMATGDLDTAWQVLTDYNNFSKFLPNIASSKVISAEGDRKIFEQVSQVDLWLLEEQFTVQIAAIEKQPQKIDFQIVQGDLAYLKGTWQLEKITENRILITHRVKVEPRSSTEKFFFYGIYESSLEETLSAIAQEIAKRSQS